MQSIKSLITTRPDLQIRSALPGDRAAIEAIVAHTCEGDGHVPRVLDQWYTDPSGEVFVALVRDQVVGAARLIQLGDDEWWMEDICIMPPRQQHDVARILHHFVLNQARQIGSGTIRFTTAPMTEAVQVLATETGFEHVASFVPYGAHALAEAGPRLVLLAPGDLPRVMEWLASSAYFEFAQHSLEADGVCLRLTGARVAAQLAAGQVFGWQPAETLVGLVILNTRDEIRTPAAQALKIGYLDAAPGALAEVARAARRLAADRGCARLRVKVVKQPEWLLALEEAGFRRDGDSEDWLFAREIHLAAHADLDRRFSSGEN